MIQADDFARHRFGHDHAQTIGNFQRPVVFLLFLVRNSQQRPRRALAGLVGMPVRLDGGELGRLSLGQRAPRRIANKNLQRCDDEQRDHRPLERRTEEIDMAFFEQVIRAHPGHDDQAELDRGGEHVAEAIGQIGVEHRVIPVGDGELAVHQLHPGGRLHPRIGHHDPEGRQGAAKGHHAGGEQVHLGADAAPAEQHDAEKPGFKHEGHRRLETEDVAHEVAGRGGERPPVGAEGKLHRNAADDADAEVDEEQLGPELDLVKVEDVFGLHPRGFHAEQHQRQPDGERRPHDVEHRNEAKLRPSEELGVLKPIHDALLKR